VGFFSSNYNKPGPGVDKDAPEKPSFFVFFEVFKRKFWHLIKVNLMFVLFNCLALVAAFFIATVYMQKVEIDGGLGDLYIRFILAAVMTLIPLITIGPVQAGFTHILRNYSREEHSFIWWDFKESFVRNFKQGMIITLIDIVVMYILAIAINFYTNLPGLVSTAASSFVVLSIIIFSMMHLYIYPMLVTVKLSVKDIYKNALIFAIIKLFPNLLILVLNLLISLAAFYNILIGAVLYVILLPSFVGLMNNFYVNPIIKKYVVNSTEPEKQEEDDEDDDEDDNNTESFYRKEIVIAETNENGDDTDVKSLLGDDDSER